MSAYVRYVSNFGKKAIMESAFGEEEERTTLHNPQQCDNNSKQFAALDHETSEVCRCDPVTSGPML